MNHISKEFHFSASHLLSHLGPDHKCSNLHGHNYVVTMGFFDNEVDDRGFVIDYGELSPIKDWIDDNLDHAHIAENEAEARLVREIKRQLYLSHDESPYVHQRVCIIDAPTSAENIAQFIFNIWSPAYSQLKTVTVSETDKTKATYQKPVATKTFYHDARLDSDRVEISNLEFLRSVTNQFLGTPDGQGGYVIPGKLYPSDGSSDPVSKSPREWGWISPFIREGDETIIRDTGTDLDGVVINWAEIAENNGILVEELKGIIVNQQNRHYADVTPPDLSDVEESDTDE